MNFIIVSGLSGSGKSIALQAMEDAGYYCIDNLPAVLLPHFAEHMLTAGEQNIAVGIDARNRKFLADAPKALAQIEALGVHYRLIFLEAEEPTTVKRYQETRRRHPMVDDHTSLTEAIQLEKRLLEPLALVSSLRIDTTRTTPQALRQRINDYVRTAETGGLTVWFESFGYKRGTPLDADFVFDVRCLPNPYWQLELRSFTGLDAPVIKFMEQYDEVHEMYDEVRRFLETWLPRFEREDRRYITVALGCTGGQHRSVYLADRLAKYFNDRGVQAQVRHRELA